MANKIFSMCENKNFEKMAAYRDGVDYKGGGGINKWPMASVLLGVATSCQSRIANKKFKTQKHTRITTD